VSNNFGGTTIGMYATVDALMGGPADGGPPPVAATPRKERRGWAWLGLIPFLAFLVIFLLLPTLGVFDKATLTAGGQRTFKPLGDTIRKESKAFWNSVELSVISALVGTVIGAMLAYAAATAKRPKWLRTLVTAFSGVAANMGGVVLAFMFISLIGRQGLATKMMKWAGWDLYSGTFDLYKVPGLVTVYTYFQIPLMFLVTLPAIDGLKESWREASSNLGGTAWTYWRRVGLPVLTPSLLGGFLLLFANAFSAFATAYALGTYQVVIVPTKISANLQGDSATRSPAPFALATWMVLVMALTMGAYLVLRRRAERWRKA
jgi:putative spermidine/putrescine transport system permease protein